VTLPSPLLQHFRALGGGLPMDVPSQFKRLVASGAATLVLPTVESGFARYNGFTREFLTAADPLNDGSGASVLRYGAGDYCTSAAGTIATIFTPNFTYQSATLAAIVRLFADSNNSTLLGWLDKDSNPKWAARYKAAGTTVNACDLWPAGFPAGSPIVLVQRFTGGGSVDLGINTRVCSPAASGSRATEFTGISIGATETGTAQASGWIGPTIVSPVVKPPQWLGAIVDFAGAAFLDPMRMFTDFMDAPDLLIPFVGNSKAYRKNAGQGASFKTYMPVVSLQFDDGVARDYTDAYASLQATGLKGSFAIVHDLIGQSGRLTLAQILEMQAAGHDIHCHTMSHGSDPTSFAAFQYETKDAKDAMEALGIHIRVFTQPGSWTGAYNIDEATPWVYGSDADNLLRANFSAYTGYLYANTHACPAPANFRWGGIGVTHTTLSAYTAAVDDMIANRTGGIFEMDLGTGSPNASDLLALCQYIAGKVAAGQLLCVPTVQQMCPEYLT